MSEVLAGDKGAEIRVPAERLSAFLEEALGALNTPRHIAQVVSKHMVRTDLRGVDSHGVGMLPLYLDWVEAGLIRPAAEPTLFPPDGATVRVNGNQGWGHYNAECAMSAAIERAIEHGVGIASVHNSSHFGAAACYSTMALRHQMIGIATTNHSATAMVPTFGRSAMLSTNPISIAAPARSEVPFVLDMATTAVAIGKLLVAARQRRPIPLGWALDKHGRPTTDPVEANRARLLLPLGGSREQGGHKGYGLGVAVDILSGVLSGATYADQFVRTPPEQRVAQNAGHFLVAIDIRRFRPIEEFLYTMDDLLSRLKASPKAEGHDRIYTAGEIEVECEAERRREGVPLAPGLVRELKGVCDRIGIRSPWERGSTGEMKNRHGGRTR